MTSNDDKIGSPPPDETNAEMDVIKDLFGQQPPAVAAVEVFSQDLFSEPKPEPAPAKPAAPAPAAEPASALPYQPKAEEDIKVVTDDDLRNLFDQSSPGMPAAAAPPPPAPEPAAPVCELPATPEAAPVCAVEDPAPEPVARHIEAEEISLDGVAEIDRASISEPAPEPEAEPEAIADPAPAPEAIADPAPAPAAMAEPVEAVDFRREHITEELGEETPLLEVDTGTKSAIVAETVEFGQVAEEVQPQNPLDDISPDEIVADLETRAQVGEMTAVAAGKKGELLQKTESLLRQLEPTGKDLLSVGELTKLYNNMNVLIEWARTMTERMDRLERAWGKLHPEDDE